MDTQDTGMLDMGMVLLTMVDIMVDIMEDMVTHMVDTMVCIQSIQSIQFIQHTKLVKTN